MSHRWAWLAGALSGVAVACPLTADDGSAIGEGDLRAAWKVVDASAIEQGKHFALIVKACPPDAELVKVDATMPVHRHGMNYRPSITALDAGQWRVDGLMFHMIGAWELRLDFRREGALQSLRQAVNLQ